MNNSTANTLVKYQDDEVKVNTVFRPLPGGQTLALTCPADRILLTGSRGGGKSDLALAHFRTFVNRGYGAYLKGMVVGVSYKSLNNILDKAKKMFSQFDDGSTFLSAAGSLVYKWPTGESLLFRVITSEEQYNSVLHGNEISHLYFEELSSFPSLDIYDICHSANRNSFVPSKHSPVNPETGEMELLPPLRSMSMASTNPYGPISSDIRKRFIDGIPYGQITKKETEVFSARTKQLEKVVTTQVAIQLSLFDNPYLPESYTAEMQAISDPKKRKAWYLGIYDDDSDNNIFGGCFDEKYNVLPSFIPPQNWRKYRAYDHGQSAPGAVLWFAISDGSDFYIDKERYSSVKGSVYVWDEWYIAIEGKPNVGLQLLSSEISRQIIYRELEMGLEGKIRPGPADNAIYNVVDGSCLADSLAKPVQINGQKFKGPTFFGSDKSPGSRPLGYERLRTAFANAKPNSDGICERPAFYVTENCKQGFLETIPNLQRDPKKPDDTPLTAIDHVADVCRYIANHLESTVTTSGTTSGYF